MPKIALIETKRMTVQQNFTLKKQKGRMAAELSKVNLKINLVKAFSVDFFSKCSFVNAVEL